MNNKKRPARFEDAPEDFLHGWLDHLSNTNDFPGNMPEGKEKEQLRKQMLMGIKHRVGVPVMSFTRKLLRWSAAAVVVSVVAVSGYLLLKKEPATRFVTLYTQTGERKMVRLPDNSTVWVGPGSGIAYAEGFNGNRQVKLLYGEALFDVSKDDMHPFSVGVDSVMVDVLGTSFNIKAYKKHDHITIGVSTGKIRVRKNELVFSYLSARDQIQIDKHSYTFNTTTMPLLDVEGLRSHRINFEDMPLADVLTMLESYYPVTFDLQDEASIRISGSLGMKLELRQVILVLQQLVEKKVNITEKSPGVYTVQSSNHKN
ncbi:FecR family protein [Chitinophaga skermanii]|uniref:FecR family protein n=1 Tax=Chitinophaga skermanii TaxID=331697 RepID=A0A327QUF2_9BACT|nr:FecR domain-containing protein [Chitinophaga skermanii]RAJ08306.1 FecR family protein [Chitinophaga skermanii]